MFALSGCQQISVNIILCDTSGLADIYMCKSAFRANRVTPSPLPKTTWIYNYPAVVTIHSCPLPDAMDFHEHPGAVSVNPPRSLSVTEQNDELFQIFLTPHPYTLIGWEKKRSRWQAHVTSFLFEDGVGMGRWGHNLVGPWEFSLPFGYQTLLKNINHNLVHNSWLAILSWRCRGRHPEIRKMQFSEHYLPNDFVFRVYVLSLHK